MVDRRPSELSDNLSSIYCVTTSIIYNTLIKRKEQKQQTMVNKKTKTTNNGEQNAIYRKKTSVTRTSLKTR